MTGVPLQNIYFVSVPPLFSIKDRELLVIPGSNTPTGAVLPGFSFRFLNAILEESNCLIVPLVPLKLLYLLNGISVVLALFTFLSSFIITYASLWTDDLEQDFNETSVTDVSF